MSRTLEHLKTFLADALVRHNDVAQDRAARITVAEEGQVSILWAAIIIGASSPWASPCSSASRTHGCTI